MIKATKTILLLLLAVCVQAQALFNEKIPLVPDNFYQDNNYTFRPTAWTDGDLSQNFNPGWTFIYPNHEIVVDLSDYQATVHKIRIYDGGGLGGVNTKLYLVRQDNDQEVFLGTYTDNGYFEWDEFNVPVNFVASKLLVRGVAGPNYGNELEVIADYTPYTPHTYTRPKKPLRNMFGVNTFWWDLMKNDVNYSTSTMYAPKYDRVKEMGISMARFYIQHKQIQTDSALWSFNPTLSDFYTDELLENCIHDGIEPLLTIMGNPPHVYRTYPDPDPNDWNNMGEYVSLVTWPNMPYRNLPTSYRDAAKLGFITAARYGRNANIPDWLMESNMPSPNWYTPQNIIKKGLGTVNYIEIGNELELAWPDSMSYMTGQMLGAFLSAIYDGHKGALGMGYGIKTADPTMQVVVAGFGRATTDGYRGIIEWCRKNRGYNPDGTLNLPFDVINYHKYSTDGNLDQYGNSTMGLPPELSGVLDIADEFVHLSNKYAQGKEVWLTEWGYDYHPQSPFRAPAYGNKSAFEVVGIWSMRSILTYAAHGIDRMCWFKLYDNYDSWGNVTATQFNSMSLLNDEFTSTNGANTSPTYQRRIVGDYFAQMKDFQNYHFDSWVINNNLKIMKLMKGDSVAYAMWHVESSSGTGASRTFTEVSGAYPFPFPTNPLIKIRHPVPGALKMDSVIVQVGNGLHWISYNATPVFIEVGPSYELLPLRFTSVTAACSGDSVLVKWTTEEDMELDHFIIQKSTNGTDFLDVFTTTNHSASLSGASYFRVIAVNHNGERKISRIVKMDCADANITVFPNPVTDYLNIQLKSETASDLFISILNSKGALMIRQTKRASSGMNSLKLDMTNFAAGTYMVIVNINGKDHSFKVVKHP